MDPVIVWSILGILATIFIGVGVWFLTLQYQKNQIKNEFVKQVSDLISELILAKKLRNNLLLESIFKQQLLESKRESEEIIKCEKQILFHKWNSIKFKHIEKPLHLFKNDRVKWILVFDTDELEQFFTQVEGVVANITNDQTPIENLERDLNIFRIKAERRIYKKKNRFLDQ